MPTMKDLVDGAADEWGNVEENIGNLVPFGQELIDKSLIGVPIDRGAVFVVQGVAGSRKTTFVLNMIINQCLSNRLPQGYHIVYDTLESGMTVERIRDIIWSIVATKYLVYWHHHNTEERDLLKLFGRELPTLPIASLLNNVTEPGNSENIETILRPEAFRYFLRTERQHKAIQMAGNVIRNWPIIICGPSEHPDEEIRKRRTINTLHLAESVKRWHMLHDTYNVRELVIDHMNEYQFADDPKDFDIQKRVIPAVAAWQKYSLGICWVVAQVGITSAREARREGVDTTAMGGLVSEAESSLTWTVEYNPDDPYFIRLKRPNKSRIGMHPDLAIKIEPDSGAFIGQATRWGDREL